MFESLISELKILRTCVPFSPLIFVAVPMISDFRWMIGTCSHALSPHPFHPPQGKLEWQRRFLTVSWMIELALLLLLVFHASGLGGNCQWWICRPWLTDDECTQHLLCQFTNSGTWVREFNSLEEKNLEKKKKKTVGHARTIPSI